MANSLPHHDNMYLHNSYVLYYGGASKEVLLEQLSSAHIALNPFANVLLANDLVVSAEQHQAIVVEVSLEDIGLKNGGTLINIATQAKVFGLKSCTLEIAVYARLNYTDQPSVSSSEASANPGAPVGSVTIYSEPYSSNDQYPKGLYLRNMDHTLWLRGYRCALDHIWLPGDRFLFVKDDDVSVAIL